MPPARAARRRPAIRNLAPTLALAAVCLAAPPAVAEEPQGDGRTQALVEDLNRVIAEAEARDLPRDELLRTLKGLVERYDAPFGHLIVRDTFQDGTLHRDPAWHELSGQWQAVAGSVVSPPTGPALETPAAPPDDAEALREKLAAVTGMVERLRNGEEPPAPPPPAQAAPLHEPPSRLALPVNVPQAFRVRLLVTLEDEPGDHEAALLLTEGEGRRAEGYRLGIERFGSRSRLVLSRVGGIGSTTLASETLPGLISGGEVHSLLLERTADGMLRVQLDDHTVIDTRDPRRPPEMHRLVLERSGGRLIVSLVEVWAPTAGR